MDCPLPSYLWFPMSRIGCDNRNLLFFTTLFLETEQEQHRQQTHLRPRCRFFSPRRKKTRCHLNIHKTTKLYHSESVFCCFGRSCLELCVLRRSALFSVSKDFRVTVSNWRIELVHAHDKGRFNPRLGSLSYHNPSYFVWKLIHG